MSNFADKYYGAIAHMCQSQHLSQENVQLLADAFAAPLRAAAGNRAFPPLELLTPDQVRNNKDLTCF
jgi:hypothetical protein